MRLGLILTRDAWEGTADVPNSIWSPTECLFGRCRTKKFNQIFIKNSEIAQVLAQAGRRNLSSSEDGPTFFDSVDQLGADQVKHQKTSGNPEITESKVNDLWLVMAGVYP